MSEEEEKENLGDSFRQSRKELLFMVGTWCVFAAWTLTYVGLKGSGDEGAPLELMWGMPKWVVVGILIPWIFGLSLTVWFAMRFMEDTDLNPGSDTELAGEEGE